MDTKDINISISESLYQLEQDDWQNVNKDLRHHGLPPVELENLLTTSQITDNAVVLSAESSRRLRRSISTLAKDCDRRQELIQELIQTNNHLRDELKEQNFVVEKQESRVKELKHLLEISKCKVKELEAERNTSSDLLQHEEEKFQQTKSTIAATCDHLQNSCVKYQHELRSLKNKMSRMHQGTAQDLQSSKLLQELKKKALHGNLEENVVNLIDSYEGQIFQLRRQVDSFEFQPPGASTMRNSTPQKTQKSLIKTYEKQLRDARKKCKIFEEKNDLLQLELEARPDLKDLREAQVKVKKLQRRLRDHKNQGHNQSIQTEVMEPLTLEHLEVNSEEEILNSICDELNLGNSAEILSSLRKNSRKLLKLEEFATDVIALSTQSQNAKGETQHAVWCDKMRHQTLGNLKLCVIHSRALPDLQKLLGDLSSAAMSQNVFKSDDASVVKMIEGVRILLRHYSHTTPENDPEKLRTIVSHFQKLFDVESFDGIFSRMNEVYVKLGEVHSFRRNLKEVLSLGDETSSAQLIDHVAELTSVDPNFSSQHIEELFHVDNLQEVAQRIDQQEEFIAIFQPLIHCLVEVLQLNTVDQILPTVKALQVLARNSSPISDLAQ